MGRLIQLDGRLIDADEQLMQLDRADYEDSLYAFLTAAWSIMDPAPWQEGWVLQAIAEHLEAVADGQIKRLIINVPPRTSKTSLCSIAFPAWVWAQPDKGPTSGPGVRFMYASYGESLSLDHSTYCRRLIKSEWYQQYWGARFKLLNDQDTKHKFGNDKGGERQITSIDARVTGRGGQVIVIDDPNSANESHSDAKIQTTIDWWDRAMSTRLNDAKTGAVILVQQRLAENDLTGHILSKTIGEWDLLCLPMEYEWRRHCVTSIGWHDPRGLDSEDEPLIVIADDGTRLARDRNADRILNDEREGMLLWPERFGPAEVAALKRDLLSDAPGQLQQLPQNPEGGIIPEQWWNLWEPTQWPPFDYIMASLDTAYTEKTENDYSAMTVWGVFTQDTQEQATRILGRSGSVDSTYPLMAPKLLMIDAWQERLQFHQLVTKVAATCTKMRVDKVLIESKAAGISVAQELRRLHGHEPWGIQLHDPKSTDKMSRLYSVQPLFAPETKEKTAPDGRKVIDPRTGKPVIVTLREGIVYAPPTEWAYQVMRQVSNFPRATHDDLVDTVSQALRHLRDIGMLQLAPERHADIEDSKQYDRVKRSEPLYPG